MLCCSFVSVEGCNGLSFKLKTDSTAEKPKQRNIMEILSDNLGYDIWEIEDIPQTTSPIWILGERHSYEDLEKIR
jgi:hypothetical protein